jgi:hypothetical protein
MSENKLKTIIWQIRSHGVTHTRLDVDFGAASPVSISAPVLTMKSTGEFSLNGTSYQMLQISALKNEFELQAGETRLAFARRPSIWSSRYEVSWNKASFELKPAGWFSYNYKILFNGVEIGEVNKSSIWNYSGSMVLPVTVATEFGIFLYWLCYVVWKNNNMVITGG